MSKEASDGLVHRAAKRVHDAMSRGDAAATSIALAEFRAIPSVASKVAALVESITEVSVGDAADLRKIVHAYIDAFKPIFDRENLGARVGMRPGQQVVVFAAVVNSDGSEGRGHDVDLAYFWSMEDAREFVRKKDVMGTDGKAVARDAVIGGDGRIWLGHPIEVRGPTSEQRDRARAKLRAALSKDEMDILGIPEALR